MKFRKKPVVIEAHQFLGAFSVDEMPEDFKTALVNHNKMSGQFWTIETLEGEHFVTVGDWIIKGVKGEFYPCKPDIFALTYELAEPVAE